MPGVVKGEDVGDKQVRKGSLELLNLCLSSSLYCKVFSLGKPRRAGSGRAREWLEARNRVGLEEP